MPIAVVGAHLSGMPLNGELRSVGGRLVERTTTAPHYRLYALSGTKPAKPGLLRVKNGAGAAIEVEVWAFRRLLSAVSSPRCRRHFDRHARTRRGPVGQRLFGRGRSDRGRTRHFQLWRLARVHGAGKSGSVTARLLVRAATNWAARLSFIMSAFPQSRHRGDQL